MPKKPNAANITHGLAQLGGGSKKQGGGGMMKGMETIFGVGLQLGTQSALGESKPTSSIETPNILQLEEGNESQENKK